MRNVYPSEELCHIWANSAQSSARNSNDSMHFEDGTLYSYSTPIAAKLGGFVLLSDAKRSVTTSKHQTYARRAGVGQTVYTVPNLDLLRTLHAQAKLGGKGLPDIAETCADSISQIVAGLFNMRSMPKMDWELRKALKYQLAGLALCKYVGCKKWPLPLLPETVPTDKLQRETMIREFAAIKIKTKYEQGLADGLRHIKELQDSLVPPVDPYVLSKMDSRITAYLSALNTTNDRYKMLYGKTSSKANSALKKLQALRDKNLPRIELAKLELADIVIEAQLIRGEHCNLLSLKQAYKTNPDTKHKARVDELLTKMQEIENKNLYQRAERSRDLAIKCEENYPSDAMFYYSRAIHHLQSVIASPDRDNLIKECEVALVPLQAAALAKEAGRLAAWISGESDTRPAHGIGHYARISGKEVETTGGARVPLEAAVRLAKLARRVIREGGKTWEAGAGPMVGHYRVNSVGVDGKCVIGCHTFSAEEAHRMIELLDVVTV